MTPEFNPIAAYEWRLLPFADEMFPSRTELLGPIWDHTFCAPLNDLHVHARSAEPRITRIPRVSRYNVPDPFPGGQMVAGSNPVSPTSVMSQDIGIALNLL